METNEILLDFGKWSTEDNLDRFLRKAAYIDALPERIDYISSQFLDVPYRHPTMVGGPDVGEQLVVNLGFVDCFTYLDYVEAMRLSRSLVEFIDNLKQVRYEDGMVGFEKRKHFFTDWLGSNRVAEQTGDIGLSVREATKTLNIKSDGSLLLQGIPAVSRSFKVVPAGKHRIAGNTMQTGDYIGIYDEAPGIDVSHVGVAIRHGRDLLLRHASSVQMKVVEQDLAGYVATKPGMLVFRPHD